MRLGSEVPRVFTPPLRELTPETSRGFDVIDFARDVLEVSLFPWQQWLLIHMLETRVDGSLRFSTVVVLVARQNGKSTLSQVLALWFMMRWGWPLVLGTAQDLDLAEEVWDGAVELLEEDDELKGLIKKVFRVNGKKSMILENKTRYKVKAANRKAGRGLSGNLIMLDELREHQSWDAWGAITKTTMAQTLYLILTLSNAGDVSSVVLRYLRKMGHQAVGDPDGICREDEAQGPTVVDVEEFTDDDDNLDDFEQDPDTLAVFEWSAPPGCDVRDRSGWAQANPSMNHQNGIPEKNVASACRTDPEWVFRTEVLCQWSDGTLEGPFPPGSWELGLNEVVEDAAGEKSIAAGDRITSQVRACIDMSADRSMTYIAFAGYRDDGAPQVEIVAKRRGSEWVHDWLMDPKRRDRIVEVTGQGRGAPISDTIKALHEEPEFTIPVVEWVGGDLMAAHGITFDAVRDGVVRHNPQPLLDLPAATAVLKQLQEGFVINRMKSPVDASPLVAFEGALWLLLRHSVDPRPAPPPPEALDEPDDDTHDDHTYTDDLASVGF